METGGDCNCFHDEADVTIMVSFVLETPKPDQSVSTELCVCSTCVSVELSRLSM